MKRRSEIRKEKKGKIKEKENKTKEKNRPEIQQTWRKKGKSGKKKSGRIQHINRINKKLKCARNLEKQKENR